MTMSNFKWAAFFKALAKNEEKFLLSFTMQNGAEFSMLLPKLEDISDNTFSDKYEWPFDFDEIARVDFVENFQHGPFQGKNDPELISEALKAVSGLSQRRISRVSLKR